MALIKIRSGGQNGTDIAALIIGKKFVLITGGWMPKGFMTADGPRPEYAELYGMKEHASSNYAVRTALNVKESDGTLRIAFDWRSSGEKCTLKAIKQYSKPYFDVGIPNPVAPEDTAKWIIDNNIKELNVAGNREQTYHGMQVAAAEYLTKLFLILGFKESKGH